MKYRTGFVSNSSASSFLIYGTRLDMNEVKSILTKLSIKCDDDYIFDLGEKLAKSLVLGYEVYSDYIYIGLSPFDFPEDKTIKEIRQEIENKIAKVSSSTCGWFEAAWHNG